jgi:uncharacterized membrane protein YdjX (TVP38/TMEM64 family)
MRPGSGSPGHPLLLALGRMVPALFLVAVAVAVYGGGLASNISLASLRLHEAGLRDVITAHPILSVIGFILFYGIGTAAFVPVGLVLMLASGFLFGPWLGAVATVSGATFGAALAYVAARFAAGETLRRRAHNGRLGPIIDGFGRNTFSYVLVLRLLPFSPFGLINLAAGLTAVPMRPFILATALGDIPVALSYCHLGDGLGEVFIEGQKLDLWAPDLLWPLVGLSILSLATALVAQHGGRLRKREAPGE